MQNQFNIPLTKEQHLLSIQLSQRIKALRVRKGPYDIANVWSEYQDAYQAGPLSYLVHTHLLEQMAYAREREHARDVYHNILDILTAYNWQDAFPFKNMLIAACNTYEIEFFIQVAKTAPAYVTKCTQLDKSKLYAVMSSNAEKLIKLNISDEFKAALNEIKKYADKEYDAGKKHSVAPKASITVTAAHPAATPVSTAAAPAAPLSITVADVKPQQSSAHMTFSLFADSPLTGVLKLQNAATNQSLAKPNAK